MEQGGLAVPVEWCLMMVSYGQGHHEVDRLHGLAGGRLQIGTSGRLQFGMDGRLAPESAHGAVRVVVSSASIWSSKQY